MSAASLRKHYGIPLRAPLRAPLRVSSHEATRLGYEPLTHPYTDDEEDLLERALVPLLSAGIEIVLVAPLFAPWPVEIWRKGTRSCDRTLRNKGIIPQPLPGEGRTHRAPQAFRDWLATEYANRDPLDTDTQFACRIQARWRHWRKGDRTCAVPGYDTCPPASDHTPAHPQGWSSYALLNAAKQIRR